MNEGFKITCRNGRRIQVMFDGTGRWVSSGYSKKEDAVNWAERQLRLKRTQTPTLADFSRDFFMRTDRQVCLEGQHGLGLLVIDKRGYQSHGVCHPRISVTVAFRDPRSERIRKQN